MEFMNSCCFIHPLRDYRPMIGSMRSDRIIVIKHVDLIFDHVKLALDRSDIIAN